MNVAHFIATLDIGGSEKQLLTLCQEQVNNGYKVVIMPIKGSNTLESEFQSIGVEIDNRFRNRNFVCQYFRALFLTKRLSEFVIHVHSAKAALILTLLPTSFGRRLVFSKHDSMQFIPQAPKSLSRLLWRWVQLRTSRVLVISEAITHEMNLRKEWINTEKAALSYYGISKDEISSIGHADREALRNSWGVSKEDLVIGTVGRLVKEKNHRFLLEVFQQLLHEKPKAILVICGYGPLESELRNKIEILDLESNVRILNDVKNAKEVYVGFDLFVLPSLTEGFGLVLLEAMSAKLPIIAARVGAIPEVLGTNYGFMFDPTNNEELLKLLALASESSVRKKIAQETNLRLNNFTSLAMFNEMDSVYRSIQS